MSAKIVYTPPTSEDPEKIEMFGQKWVAGKVVTVSDDMAIRLMGHPHFERKDRPKESDDGEGSETPPTPPSPPVSPPAPLPAS